MTIARFRQTIAACIVAWTLLGTSAWAVAQSAERKDEERWFVVQMQGRKCGYMYTAIKHLGEEVHSRSLMQFEIARGAAKLKILMEQSYRETVAGSPLGFKHKMTMGSQPTSMTGIIKGKRLTLITEQFGTERKATYDFDPEVKFAWGQYLEQAKHGFKPGTTYTIKIYEPSLKADGPIAMKVEVRGKEDVEVLGKTRRLNRITATMQLPMPIPTETWVDDDDNLIVTTVDLGIMKVNVLAATKEEALGDAEAPELFLNTFVRVKRTIDPDAKRVRLRLRLPADASCRLPDLPRTSMQTVKRISDREAVVTIQRIDWEKLRAVRKDVHTDRETIKEYLRASTTCDIDDQRIKKLARKAIKGCKTPAEKADALRRFVTDYVKDKNLDVGFATASEVARTREGDCSEHGVLLAALARAAGLPARGVSGLVQIPAGSVLSDEENAFGYHMWTQVYIDGRWVDIDAALRQTDVDPTHIALSLMPLNDEGMLEQAMTLLALIGRLQIEVIEVEN
ncbi:MAG: transglutaminase family protein [Phycisphaerae bacterium]|nr:transglutaminase family protein [Phycisphaerae bacterium]